MTKKINATAIVNELEGSAFFPNKKGDDQSSTQKNSVGKKQSISTSTSSQAIKKSTNLPVQEKIEKYTTHLEPSMIKKIKIHASEYEIKDYQVVKDALLLYFDKYKK